MFKHYLLTIFRILSRNKLNLVLNLIGLTLGLSASFIVLNYVLTEAGFDKFHEHKNRIYRILTEKPDVNWTEPKTSYILTKYITDYIPEVEKVTSIGYLPYAQIKNGDEFERAGIFRTATNEIFEIFTFKFIEGNPAEALIDPFSVTISKDIADQYFPGESAVGKTIELNNRGNLYTLIVTGVYENIPKLSSIKADFIGHIELSFREFAREEWSKDIRTAWYLDFFRTFVLLNSDTKPEVVEEKFRVIESDFMGDKVNFIRSLQKLGDMYLHSGHLMNAGLRGSLTNLYIFSAIGFVILLIACFNYIILSIGQSTLRTKEIGIRKVTGATKNSIIRQILGESVSVSILSMPLAMVVVHFALPKMNQLFRTGMEINYGENLSLLLLFIILTLIVGIGSGSYISFYLAKYDPVHVFKNKIGAGKSKALFQKVLITIQIFFFVCLFSGSQIIFKQISLGKKADLGFNYTNLAHMEISRRAIVNNYLIFKQELLRNPDILFVSGGNVIPPNNSRMVTPVPLKEDPEQKVNLEGMGVDFDFFKILELSIIEGREFSRDFPTDSGKFIINETAVKMLGLKNPVGEILMGEEIIGVVRDFQVHSIHEGITPLEIQISKPKYISEYLIKYREGRFSEVSEYCKNVLSKMAPDSYLDFQPFEDRLGDMYSKEKRLGRIAFLFGSIAIVIAILGLFGHSLFVARQQTREIGIRKIHGALTRDILRFYGSSFIKTTIVANILACPIVIFVMQKWLQNFTYQASIGIVIFMLSFLVSLIVVVVTIISQSLNAANVNPAKTLRYE